MNQETRPSSLDAKSNEPPGHDIFCTPENSDFLSKVHYQDLNPTEREIRLLEILPDSGSGFIECELLPSVKLADVHKQYLALSYCAGNPHNTKAIIVNGTSCNVFANLHHALAMVRNYWETQANQRDLLLWVDQICINQFNLEERSHQVGFMKEIYQSAQETLICLSLAETEGRGMKRFIEFRQRLIQYLAENSRAEITEVFVSVSDIHTYTSDISGEEDLVDSWDEFFHVLNSPWWERAWVFQEFMVSSRPIFLSGRYSMPYDEMRLILMGISFATIYLEDRLFRLPQRSKCSVEKIKEALERAYKMILAKGTWVQNGTLANLLVHTSSCKASDPRDRIFSVLDRSYPHNKQDGLPSWAVNWMEKINPDENLDGIANNKIGDQFRKHYIKLERADASFYKFLTQTTPKERQQPWKRGVYS
ncbi:Heterokaryon incompatibility protein 6, OR allele [Fusarium austroafricanum]|uniref:Heterokaryon incompatibility protein 6, OR allele n=1 Tax=Fusarium austroafricanum TaxID=2364996 RepID=A0A8H4KNL2_9HYPO|nr:Heterokaryon incompatibility protein 6, OR allele [Fusarium austroafricanum]